MTYFLINITWVFFRAQDFATAWRVTASMLLFGAGETSVVPTIDIYIVGIVMAVLVTIHWLMRDRSIEQVVRRTPWWLVGIAWGAMLWAIIVTQGSGDAFIYFQF